ncbi:Uma2 family endonuclease [Calothrix sp. CCY 0018]|uniref:Uma2 family endonuclease n=1 Tax=Calothrix sp. CCY 0018 TaxID=3103864 RepID=UPI0039C5E696
MVANPQFQYMSPQEYLEWEKTQELRYEYIDGEVFLRTGKTKIHNRICFNLYIELDRLLVDKEWEIYACEVKLKITSKSYHYPDVTVTCDERDKQAIDMIRHPCLIVEVLSPSTEAFDRGKKFTRYRQSSTLKEYVLIASDEIAVECFRRNDEGLWVLRTYGEGDTLNLESVGISIPVEKLYRRVRFDVGEKN